MSMRLRRQFLQFTAASLLAPTAILVSGANSSDDGPFKPLVKALLDIQKPVPIAVAKYLEAKHLAALGVVDCDLDDDSGYLIAEFISKFQSLRMVFVEENNFSEQAKDSIVEAGSKLAGCKTIV